MNIYWLHLNQSDILTEWLQINEEGRDAELLRDEYEAIQKLNLDEPQNQERAKAFLDAAILLPIDPVQHAQEPDELEAIRALRPAAVALAPVSGDLMDKIEGAWLGRCSGCLLGKPIEGLRSPVVYPVLEASGNWPLQRYLHSADGWEASNNNNFWLTASLIDKIDGMPEDDDINYSISGLAIFKQYGKSFTSNDVATFWMENIPVLRTCTAERIAYRNFLNGVNPPESASFRNPYREWIGAQIRADFWGYVNPGNPELAAEMAWRDARISHIKNGIYGEMWVAAMLAAAYTTDDVSLIIRAGLAQIPAECRLANDIRAILDWFEVDKVSYEEAEKRIRAKYDEEAWHPWTHTITNAAVVAVGLLWGEGDFALSICRAVQPLYDTDCNGATVGSIMGVILGRKALPDYWIEPVSKRISSGVKGYESTNFEALAKVTYELL